MKILKISGIVIASLVGIYFLVISLMPSKVYVERSIVVDAGQAEIFNYLEDLRNFQEWAPWAEIDPNTKYEYVGALKGVGTQMNWHSDNIGMGYGSLWIDSTTPNSEINLKIQLREFAKPADMNFYFTKEGNSTRVTWDFQTDFHGFWKFYIPMTEKEFGPDYEKGLLKIKRFLEKSVIKN